MSRISMLGLMALVAIVACRQTEPESKGTGSHAAARHGDLEAVHLPDGDAQRGLRTFQDLRCTACHQVAGYDFPDQRIALHPPILLGEDADRHPTAGELVTALIAPGHELAPSFRGELFELEPGESVMADYNDVLTVRDLLDLVAFLRDVHR